ncbi:WbqC family protein [Flavicella sediminum]|uniref:WbqC family protein n=1 Tax=Flavicella sediminum TaxID=2585141 RepID=UPI0011246E5F|nr:WbqC family protein [Flavicella sediminum]
MKFGIMQAYFFPYIGYFQLIDHVDCFMIYEHVSFRKKSWITRNRILDKGNNLPITLNVPVVKQSSSKSIGETMINNSTDWRNKNLNLIFFNYKKASFFDEIFPVIVELLNENCDSIHEYNSQIISGICNLLDINTKIIASNEKYISMEKELRLLANQNSTEEKTQRIFEICKTEGTNNYVNPIGGIDLYNKDEFSANDIQLDFVQTLEYKYKQFNCKFEPHLSIIDVLMHNGVAKTKGMIHNYKVV